MSDTKVGQLISADALRDAIHVAIAPVVAAENLDPGDHVGLDANENASKSAKHIGIVDPFLTKFLQPGDWFYLFLYPQTVTGMRHHWEHPSFCVESMGSKAKKNESEAWLRKYAARLSPYDEPNTAYANLIGGLLGREIYAHGSDLHGLYELDDAEDLKYHAQIVLGIQIKWDEFSFNCSC